MPAAVSGTAASYACRMVGSLLAILLFLGASPLVNAAYDRSTRVILYTVTDSISGKLRPGCSIAKKAQGSYWIGSIGASRPDARRCMTGNNIIDPGFAPTLDAHVVYCQDSSGPKRLLALVLTKRLPLDQANHGSPDASGTPTALTLAGGVTRSFASGPTGVVGGMRINYGCPNSHGSLRCLTSRASLCHRMTLGDCRFISGVASNQGHSKVIIDRVLALSAAR